MPKKEKSDDFAVSANLAYGEVRAGVYEDPDRMIRSSHDQGNYELTEYSASVPSPDSQPEVSLYDTADGVTSS